MTIDEKTRRVGIHLLFGITQNDAVADVFPVQNRRRYETFCIRGPGEFLLELDRHSAVYIDGLLGEQGLLTTISYLHRYWAGSLFGSLCEALDRPSDSLRTGLLSVRARRYALDVVDHRPHQ